MKKILFTLLSIVVCSTSFSQSFSWAKRIGGPLTDVGKQIKVNAAGEVVTAGYYELNPSVTTGEGSYALPNAGGKDIFFSKSDALGNFLWIRTFGGTSSEDIYSMYLDAASNIYMSGSFQGTVDFDPGVGVANLTSAGLSDSYLIKFDSDGNFVWVKQIGGTGTDIIYSLSLDGDNNIVITGTFEGTADFDPGAGVSNLVSVGGKDVFVSKLTNNGDYIWANRIGNSANVDVANDVVIASNNDIIITGQFTGTVDFDPEAGTTNHAATGLYDAYLLKLNTIGQFVLVKSIAGANFGSASVGVCLEIDNSDNIFWSGSGESPSDFDPGPGTFTMGGAGYDLFLVKLDVNGDFQWAKSFVGTDQTHTFDMMLDAANNCFITGFYLETVDFDPGVGVENRTPAGMRDIFVLKTNQDGEFDWVQSLGSTGQETSCGIFVDANNFIYSTGYFFNTVDFDPTSGVYNLNTGGGSGDIYILKWADCVPQTANDVITACDSYTWIDGITYTASNNTATHVLQTVAGCDSTITLNLTIHPSTNGVDILTACDSYTWIDGITYTTSNNTATHLLQNVNGCDSTVSLNLTILSSTTGDDYQSACNSYTWVDGITYTNSTSTPTYNYTNSVGCDSVVTLHLTILTPTSGTDVQQSCGPFTWIDGNTYYASNNTATHTLTAVNGCDSIVTLNLTINEPDYVVNTIEACDSYMWIDGGTYVSSTTTPFIVLTNQAGCDSTVILHLTIHTSTSSTQTVTACGSYTWIDCNIYTQSTNTPTYTIPNAIGCDSVITLDLTIIPNTSSTDVITSCDPYTWIDNVTYASSNSTATHVLSNQQGCDSIVTLNLTILQSSSVTQMIQSCSPYTWIDGNTYATSTNSPQVVLTNIAGCDSIISLNLSVTDIDTSISINAGVLTVNQSGANYQWMDCSDGTDVPGATNQSYDPGAPGTYAVKISLNGCTDVSSCRSNSGLKLNVLKPDDVLVFPNPTNQRVNIKTELIIDQIIIRNSFGQVVQIEKEKEFSVELLAAGFYLLDIQTEKGIIQRNFVKE